MLIATMIVVMIMVTEMMMMMRRMVMVDDDDNKFLLYRVIFMDVPNDTILERVTLRSIDPVTGDR